MAVDRRALYAALHTGAFLLNGVFYLVSLLIYYRFVEDPEGERAAIAAGAGLPRATILAL